MPRRPALAWVLLAATGIAIAVEAASRAGACVGVCGSWVLLLDGRVWGGLQLEWIGVDLDIYASAPLPARSPVVHDRSGWFAAYIGLDEVERDFFRRSMAAGFSTWSIPLWPVELSCLGGTIWFFRSLRPRRHGSCTCCGYDLRGLASPVCPECGQPFSPPPTRT